MSGYELYWFPGTCARVPFVALEEIGEPFEVKLVNIVGERPPELLAVNPKAKVPVLVTPERVVTENPAIATYLNGRHPGAGLLPTGDPDTELTALETMSWLAAGVHPHVTRLRFPRFFSDMPEAYDGIRNNARGQLEQAFAVLEGRLEDRDWLFGDWSIIDVHVLWLWFRATGSGMDGTPFPRCAALAARCEERPSVARVLEREVAEFERLDSEGAVPPMPDFQVGHAPVY